MIPCPAKPWISAGMMRYKIMMKARFHSTPDSSVAMIAFRMCRMIKAFANDTPLHGKILIVIKTGHFIISPAKRAMIKNNVGAIKVKPIIDQYLNDIDHASGNIISGQYARRLKRVVYKLYLQRLIKKFKTGVRNFITQ